MNAVLTISVLSKFTVHLMDQESEDSDAGCLVSACQIALVGHQHPEQDSGPLALDMKLRPL